MKQSLKTKLAILFVSILIAVLGIVMAANKIFLEKYYIKTTEKKLVQIYEELESGMTKGLLEDTDYQLAMERESETSNVSILLLTDGKEYSFSRLQNTRALKDRIFLYNLRDTFPDTVYLSDEDMNRDTGMGPGGDGPPVTEELKFLLKMENYNIVRCTDSRNGMSYLEMWGEINDSGLFAMRIPLESISRSSDIANRFLLIISAAAICLGLLLLLFFANWFLKPVEELTALSEKMAELDFDVRYTGGGSSEIAILGENFNRMSESLESALKDLKTANLTLQKDLEMKDKREEQRKEFLANVSHELKTPLAVIEGYAEGLQSPLGEIEDKRVSYSQIIVEETQKMNGMLKNLLRLSELEALNPEMERFDITEMMRGVADAERMTAEQAGIEILMEEKESCYVWGDPFCIEQVITNYLTNAIRYASGENKVVRIYAENTSDADKVRICVFNTGEHIAEEQMPRIWEKFYKIDKVRSRKKGGTGIGLSIVKAVMDLHGQAYGVKNEKDGVTFWFELNRR